MTVAVVVNYKQGKDADGKDALLPLTEAEKEEVASLVREAMGFNRERGDSLSVLNTRFAPAERGEPIWKRQETLSIAKDVGKYVIIGAIFLYLYLAFLKPMIYKLSGREEADRKKKEAQAAAKAEAEARVAELAAEGDLGAMVSLSGLGMEMSEEEATYKQLLEVARGMARNNPKAVANIILEWLGND